jgi:hypothetical protein
LGRFANLEWRIPPTACRGDALKGGFPRFSALGTGLDYLPASGPRFGMCRPEKGRNEMSGQSRFARSLVAAAAALLMSSVAVGTAVGPAQAGTTSVVAQFA